MVNARLAALVLAAAAGGEVRAGLVTHAAAGYGSAPLTGPNVYGGATATAEIGYPGAWMRAEAWAGYGRVGAMASVEAEPALYPINRALAESAFSDRLRLDGPIGAGFVVYRFTVTGNAEGHTHAHVFLSHQGSPDVELGHLKGPEELESQPYGVVFGQEFSMGASLMVLAAVEQGKIGHAIGDFLAGVELTGIGVFDGQMQPVPGWSVWSESGTAYPVPGPGSAVALVCGVVMFRRKRVAGHSRS